MAGILQTRIWQPCICQPNELKREINKKKNRGGQTEDQAKIWGAMAHPGPPLESPLDVLHCKTPLVFGICVELRL